MTPTSNSETLSLVLDGRSLEDLFLIFLVTSVPSIRYSNENCSTPSLNFLFLTIRRKPSITHVVHRAIDPNVLKLSIDRVDPDHSLATDRPCDN